MKKSKYLLQINKLIKEGQLSLVKGSCMEEFENKAAKLFDNKYGVSTCNGTSALYLSLFCLSLNSNKKEVIIPNYGFHVSVSVICSIGLKPVFCDVDINTYAIDFDKCQKLINKNTLAVMVLQPWGNLANLDKISKIRKKYNIFFISDSSHAHESTWNGQGIGKYFDINCASFGLGKLISGGELGILTTDNPLYYDRALLFSHTNRVPDDLMTNEYNNIDNNIGIKFRPHIFSLLLALNDLSVNKNIRLKTKRNILKFQKEMVKNTDKVSFQKSHKKASRTFHMPIIEFNKEIDTNGLINVLKDNGFNAQIHNYKTILSRNSITTKFYKIKTSGSFPISQEIIDKKIIQLFFSDFSDQDKISKLKKIILGYLHDYN